MLRKLIQEVRVDHACLSTHLQPTRPQREPWNGVLGLIACRLATATEPGTDLASGSEGGTKLGSLLDDEQRLRGLVGAVA